MNNKFKKILSLLLVTLLLITALTACTSYDENYTIYELWVAGVKVTTRNQADILGDGTVSFEGSVKSGVLTLNGANIQDCSDPDAEAIIVSTIDALTLNLVGENKIGMGDKAPVNGISAYDLTIKGEGSLDVAARASCIKADEFIVESGKIDAYIKTAKDEVASFLGVGLWAQQLLKINGGDIAVHYLAEFSPLSYGLYCVKDLTVNGGNIRIDPKDSQFLAVGLISSQKLTIAGGNISVYGFDDAMNAKTFAMTGGTVNASAIDLFPPMSDGACRLVNKAEFSGGEMAIMVLGEGGAPALYSKDLSLGGMKVLGGKTKDDLAQKDPQSYKYADTCILITKEAN